MVQSLLKLAGLNCPVPDFSTVWRRQKRLNVEIGFQRAGDYLHLLVDNTGIKMLGEGEWKTRKHGADYRRQWRKVHLGINARSLEIRAIEVTDNACGDAPMLPCLLDQIGSEEPLLSVSVDGAYDTKGCHEAIARRGAAAVIPCRKNAKPWKDRKPGALARNEIVRATRRLVRAIWKKWSGYHWRSLVETKMNCSVHDHLAGGIDRVDLDQVLGQIDADSRNLAHGTSPSEVVEIDFSTCQSWHSDAVARKWEVPSYSSAWTSG